MNPNYPNTDSQPPSEPGSPAIRNEFSPPEANAGRWQPGLVEVELKSHVRRDIVRTPASANAPMAVSVTVHSEGVNEFLQRHRMIRMEPSFAAPAPMPPATAAALSARGEALPHHDNFLRLHFDPDADVQQIARDLSALPDVERAVPVPNVLPPASPFTEPLTGIPLVPANLNVPVPNPVTGFENQWYLFRCEADAAWNSPVSGAGVVVADIDFGYRVTHQDLAPNLNLALAHNSVDGSTNVSQGSGIAHGTAVMGILAGTVNDVGLTGFAFEAELWPIQSNTGSGVPQPGDPWANAIEFVRGANSAGRRKVINLEVQTGTFGNFEMVPSVNAAIRFAIASGIVVCVAAGNGNRSAELDDQNPPQPIPPTGSILVGATEFLPFQPLDNVRASFSNFGTNVVVAAPGDPNHDLTCSDTADDAYRNGFGGTSGATPKVSGTAALMLQANPRLTHNEVRDILKQTGTVVTTDAAKPVGTFLNTGAAVAQARIHP